MSGGRDGPAETAPAVSFEAEEVEAGGPVRISVTEAKARLAELVRRAEAGEEVVLTRHGRTTVRLVPVRRPPDAEMRLAAIAAIQAAARKRLAELGDSRDKPLRRFDESGRASDRDAYPGAARSQDFLYDENGLPD